MQRLLLTPFLLAASCTLNVASVDHEFTARTDTAFVTVGTDLTDPADDLGNVGLVVTGSDRGDALGTARIVGLRGANEVEASLLAGWGLAFYAVDSTRADLAIETPGNARDVWMETLALEVPRTTDVVLTLGEHSLHARGLEGRVEATSTSGSMIIETAGVLELSASSGSLDVAAAAGTLTTSSGSMRLALDGWVNATANSGSIAGSIGDGGSVETNSGSISLTLTEAPTRDLLLTARSGSIVLRVPEGAPMTLDLASEGGNVAVRAGEVSYGGDAFTGDLAGGGPRIQIRTGSGSIVVTN